MANLKQVTFTDDWYSTKFLLDGEPDDLLKVRIKGKWYDVIFDVVTVYYSDHGHRYPASAERYHFTIKTELGDQQMELYILMKSRPRLKIYGIAMPTE